jgi:E3 ubiquitin-protein ligase HECTD2
MAPSDFHNSHWDRRQAPDDIFNRIQNGVFATSAPSSRAEQSSRSISNNHPNNRNPGITSRDQPHSQSQPIRPLHLRSMSHPFPAMLGGKKKGPDSSSDLALDLDWVDDDGKISKKQAPRTHTRAGPSIGSKDFATGNCMTCASLVRWPKDLKVFKCTICSTINDLVPVPDAGQVAESQRRDPRQASFGTVHGKGKGSRYNVSGMIFTCLSIAIILGTYKASRT